MNDLFGGIDSLEVHSNSEEELELDLTLEDENSEEEVEDSIDTSKSQKPSEENEDDDLIEIMEGDPKDTKEEIAEDESPQESPSIDNSKIEAYSNFMEGLHKSGAISSFDKDEFVNKIKEGANPDELIIEAKQAEIEARVNERFENLSDEEKALYEGRQSGAPLDKLGEIDRALKFYNELDDDFFEDPDNDDTNKKIIASDLQTRGFSQEEIDEQLDIYEEKDLLSTKAKKSASVLKNALNTQKETVIESNKKAAEQRKREIEDYKAELKNTINTTKELLPDLPLDTKMKNQLYKDFTEPVRYDENNQPVDIITDTRNKNPEMFDIALRYYNRIGLFNFDKDNNFKPDLSKINSKLQTKEAKRIGSIINNTDAFIAGTSSKQSNDDKNLDLFGGI